jgi:hypothetical protein
VTAANKNRDANAGTQSDLKAKHTKAKADLDDASGKAAKARDAHDAAAVDAAKKKAAHETAAADSAAADGALRKLKEKDGKAADELKRAKDDLDATAPPSAKEKGLQKVRDDAESDLNTGRDDYTKKKSARDRAAAEKDAAARKLANEQAAIDRLKREGDVGGSEAKRKKLADEAAAQAEYKKNKKKADEDLDKKERDEALHLDEETNVKRTWGQRFRSLGKGSFMFIATFPLPFRGTYSRPNPIAALSTTLWSPPPPARIPFVDASGNVDPYKNGLSDGQDDGYAQGLREGKIDWTATSVDVVSGVSRTFRDLDPIVHSIKTAKAAGSLSTEREAFCSVQRPIIQGSGDDFEAVYPQCMISGGAGPGPAVAVGPDAGPEPDDPYSIGYMKGFTEQYPLGYTAGFSAKREGAVGVRGLTPPNVEGSTPETSEDISGEAISGEAISREPIAGEAISGEPISGEAISGEPISGEPISGEPISGEPISGEPISGEPISGEPISGEPISGEGISGKSAAAISSAPTPISDRSSTWNSIGGGSSYGSAAAADNDDIVDPSEHFLTPKEFIKLLCHSRMPREDLDDLRELLQR